jgi:hypothetical protein
MSDETNTSMTALEMDIAETRQSLDRKLDEIGRRLQPGEVTSELKETVKRRSEPYLGYIAGGLIAAGTLMAVSGFRRNHSTEFPSREYDEYPDDNRAARAALDCY